MKKSLYLLIAAILVIPCLIFGSATVFADTVQSNTEIEEDCIITADYSVYAVYDDVATPELKTSGAVYYGTTISGLYIPSSVLDTKYYTYTKDLYKDPACTQKYSACDYICPGTKIYIKYTSIYYTINLPYLLDAVKKGPLEPGTTSFTFKLDTNASSDSYTIISDTVTTNGSGQYSATLSFKTKARTFDTYFKDGFKVKQVIGSEQGWFYDPTVYTLTVDPKSGNITSCVSDRLYFNESAVATADLEFTNKYFSYSVVASAGEGGSIDPDGQSDVVSGDSLSYAITPDEGYVIKDVLVDGESVGAVESYDFTEIDADHTIEATFEKEAVDDDDDTPDTPKPEEKKPAKPSKTIPKTSDSNIALICMAAGALVLSGIVLTIARRRRQSR